MVKKTGEECQAPLIENLAEKTVPNTLLMSLQDLRFDPGVAAVPL